MSWRNNKIWRKGLICKSSTVTSNQVINSRILRKGYSGSRDFSWIKNYKLLLIVRARVWNSILAPFFNSFMTDSRYCIETSPLICSANQWTSFYMITASVMKELKAGLHDKIFLSQSVKFFFRQFPFNI